MNLTSPIFTLLKFLYMWAEKETFTCFDPFNAMEVVEQSRWEFEGKIII